MKKAYESKTIWAGATAIVSAVVALIMHYTGEVPLDPTAVGGTWTAAIMGALFVWLRYMTSQGIGDVEPEDRPVQRRRRKTGIGGLHLIVLAGLWGLLAACPARELRGDKAVLEVEDGPPCVIKVLLDGKVVQIIETDEKCRWER